VIPDSVWPEKLLKSPPFVTIGSETLSCVKPKIRQPASVSKILFAIGAIWAAMSLVFVFIGGRLIARERLFDSESATVEGTLAAKRMEEKNGIDRETKRPIVTRTYFLTLKFHVTEEREMEVENSVSKERWESLQEGAPILVQYLLSDPTQSRIAGDSEKLTGYVLTSLGAGGALLGLFFVFRMIRSRSL
jgi:hypothetical protein